MAASGVMLTGMGGIIFAMMKWKIGLWL
jgi:hypothetical protein